MKFYMTPGSCSTGIHILLEELELVFEVYLIDLLAGDNRQPDYLAINPKGTIPTLVTDQGERLTDYIEIALWLANSYPRFQLMPQNDADKARVHAVLKEVVQTIHGQGFTRIFTTETYTRDTAESETVKAQGRQIIDAGFAAMEGRLKGSIYVCKQFSIADTALFYVEFWADRIGLTLPTRLRKHYQTLLQRPTVRQVLGEEGYGAFLQTQTQA